MSNRGEQGAAPVAGAGPAPAIEGPAASRLFLTSLVVLTIVMNTVGRGVTESFAVFLLPVEKGIGATRSEMTATYSFYMLAYGLSAPFAGQLVDRLGARLAYGLGLLVMGSGIAMASIVTQAWQYALCIGLLGGLGSALLGMVIASALLSRWFTRGIGAVMSLPYAAVGAGMLVVPPLSQILIDAYGWRQAYWLMGLGVLGLLPLVMALPLGRITQGSESWRERRRRAAADEPRGPWPVGAAVRTSAFWGLFGAYFATSVAAYSVLPQSVAYLVELGFDPLVAATAFGLTGALSAVGIVGVGWVSDRIGRKETASITYVSSMLGTASLLCVALWPSLLLVYGFVLFFGLMQGVRGPIILAMVAVLFPGGAVGSIFGTLSLAMGTGAATGSWVSGLLHEWTGHYYASFALGILGSATGMSLFWLVRSLREEKVR